MHTDACQTRDYIVEVGHRHMSRTRDIAEKQGKLFQYVVFATHIHGVRE